PQCLRRSWPTAGYTFELKGQLHVARHFKRLSVASPTYRLLAGSRLVHAALGGFYSYVDRYWPKNLVHSIGRVFPRRVSDACRCAVEPEDNPGFRAGACWPDLLYGLPKRRLGYRTIEPRPVPAEVGRLYRIRIHQLVELDLNNKIEIALSQSPYDQWRSSNGHSRYISAAAVSCNT
ncbi:MAG TPA: hypothetical protein VMR62_12645, partial [Bryobacteraceae bacterium]|nr:hypothetical protein [Bryobacteraceae bacterium]